MYYGTLHWCDYSSSSVCVRHKLSIFFSHLSAIINSFVVLRHVKSFDLTGHDDHHTALCCVGSKMFHSTVCYLTFIWWLMWPDLSAMQFCQLYLFSGLSLVLFCTLMSVGQIKVLSSNVQLAAFNIFTTGDCINLLRLVSSIVFLADKKFFKCPV